VTRREAGDGGPVFFEDAAAFGAWLARNAARAGELVVGFRKVGSGMPSLSWPESVDEALCFGWIDGVRKRIDGDSYQIRFTPRREGSIWSAVNIAKAQALIDQGRMRPAGLEAFARRTEPRSRVYSYEQAGEAALGVEEAGDFKRNKAAWRYFESAPPGYRRVMLHWVASAKRPATRARRLSQLIAACAAGTRILK
jgi:uncharacterized protein YdeI (YjbR/CyaY-like superfamily)